VRVQTILDETNYVSIISLKKQIANDLDYLAARLNARRSLMAEAEKLDSLCHIQSLPEFYAAIFPGADFKEVIDFQRFSVYELIKEISGFSAYMSGPGAKLLDWTLVRFQTENLKVLIRACMTKTPVEEIYGHLISLPKELFLNVKGLASAESPEVFAGMVPKGLLRNNLEKAIKIYHDYPRSFFFEAALDKGYFQGLIARLENLPHEDLEIIKPMIYQEADIFHLMLVARGKFHYKLTPEMLRPLHVEGTRIPCALFADMLNDPDINASVERISERILDISPSGQGLIDGLTAADASILEGLAWKRFFRLANLAFRRNHMGLGAIMGYVDLRRVEVANLITISEGISSGIPADKIRERLIPRSTAVESYSDSYTKNAGHMTGGKEQKAEAK